MTGSVPVNDADDRDAGGEVRLLLTGAETRGRLALVETRERRGEGPPRHRHRWEDEIVYVLPFVNLVTAIPAAATAPALIVVGCLMVSVLGERGAALPRRLRRLNGRLRPLRAVRAIERCCDGGRRERREEPYGQNRGFC